MNPVAKVLYAVAKQPHAPACYRPGGGEPVRPIEHPTDRQPGYVVRLPSGAEVFVDGTGVIRSLPNSTPEQQNA